MSTMKKISMTNMERRSRWTDELPITDKMDIIRYFIMFYIILFLGSRYVNKVIREISRNHTFSKQ